MRKTLLTASIVALVISLTGCEDTATIPDKLTGKWYQTKNGIDGVQMTASVYSSSIEIEMDFRDSDSTYWMGSFSGKNNPKGSYKIVSQGDSDAMSLSLFGSSEKTKLFTYKDGRISYKFEMLGKTTTVYLEKADSPKINNHIPEVTRTPTSNRNPSVTTKPRTPAVKVPAAPAVKPPTKK